MIQYMQLFFFLLIGCSAVQKKVTLKQLHVLFRHGDRAPDVLYPKDPHINDTWYPEGLGALTKLGKQQEFDLGRSLRKTYHTFLGDTYTYEIMDARTTDVGRTKSSLLLVSAGLWPPDKSDAWNVYFPWQPIPYNYVPFANDTLFRPPLYFCPKFKEIVLDIAQTGIYEDFFIVNAEVIQYVSHNTGLKIKDFSQLYNLYFNLDTEKKTGRVLPEWTKNVFPEFFEQATCLFYELQTHNSELKKITVGNFVKKIIDDAQAKIHGSLIPKGRKLFLYSAHEFNIAFLLRALNLYKRHIPPYAAYLAIELHEIQNEYGFRIYYQDYEQNKPRLLEIPGCDTFCPFKKFVEITSDIIPTDKTC